MKKILCLVLAAVMALFTLTACSKSQKAIAKPYNTILESLVYDDADLPVLKVATSPDFAPMEFVDLSRTGDDQFVGFDLLLAKFIAKELGCKLKIMPMSFDACQAAVQTGAVDLAISGFSWTEERAQHFLISDYYEAGNENEQVVITTKANAGKWTKAEDFKGVKVGAQGASLQEKLCNEQLKDCGAEIILFENLNDAVMALMTGKIDALACAQGNGEAFISANKKDLAQSGYMFEVADEYKANVILLNLEDDVLLAKVNACLAKAEAAGYYIPWYEACQLLNNIKTLDELGYDDDGNKITE